MGAGEADIFSLHARTRANHCRPASFPRIDSSKDKNYFKPSRIQQHEPKSIVLREKKGKKTNGNLEVSS